MDVSICYHCGNVIPQGAHYQTDAHAFCCMGCQTVYELLSQNGLSTYYDFEKNPGASPTDAARKFDFLRQAEIAATLLDYESEEQNVVSLYIPHIHCSSCIWILEHLQKLEPGVIKARVHFTAKKVHLHYNPQKISLYALVMLLTRIGYEPLISWENTEKKAPGIDRSSLYKIGVAFFCFGNIMLLSFPEYFEWNEYWINQYRPFLRSLIFALSLPSFFYAASGYYVSAWRSLQNRALTIEVPIALGIVVMFVRSSFDMWFDHGPGFFDSMCGLIFFMLLGRLFQQKTYDFLSFERDYKSYFPVAVTAVDAQGGESALPLHEVKKGDRLFIRNNELIPADGGLLSPTADIDYSFVTGEAQTTTRKQGEKVFAGGKHQGTGMLMEVWQPVSQSYLTQLWGNQVFQQPKTERYQTLTNHVSAYFTPALLGLAFLAMSYWLWVDLHAAFDVFTAILIVACPCALALSAPFTLGNVIRLMGQRRLYLKNTAVIERMARIDTIVFDKTGTLTTAQKQEMQLNWTLTASEQAAVKAVLRGSNHPLSRMVYDRLPDAELPELTDFIEETGQGIRGVANGLSIVLGSASWVGYPEEQLVDTTAVHLCINGQYRGSAQIRQHYRPGLQALFARLNQRFRIVVLSGDNDSEKNTLQAMLPADTHMYFNQKPDDKLKAVQQWQAEGKKVLMIGDGLNDAGALMQSEVGIALSEDVNVFSPACDAIMDARELYRLDRLLQYARHARLTIYISFAISFLYNIVGLYFAITHQLHPVVAAIIMPLSTITIVSVVTALSSYFAHRADQAV